MSGLNSPLCDNGNAYDVQIAADSPLWQVELWRLSLRPMCRVPPLPHKSHQTDFYSQRAWLGITAAVGHHIVVKMPTAVGNKIATEKERC
jgi:hypothetical protein